MTGELIKKAKRIEIASRRIVDELLAGQYHSVFKGRGVIFADVRPYCPGDDVRTIDWNVSARMNHPHVKQFVEERNRTVNLIIDMGASGQFGSQEASKREIAAELAAVVAFSAIKNHDRVGLYLVTDRVERFVPPAKGRKHVMRVIGEILSFQPASRRTDLAAGLALLGKLAQRRSVVFLVSDFLSEGWEQAMRIASQRHEIVPVVVTDPLEQELPAIGLVQFEDLVSGEVIELDTGGVAARDFARLARQAAEQRDLALRRMDLEVVEIGTDEEYLDVLVGYFRARARRARR